MNAILERLAAVEAELQLLQVEVEELRALAGAAPVAAPAPPAPPPPQAQPAIWPPPRPVRRLAPKPPPEQPARPRRERPQLDLAWLMSARTLAFAGGVVMLLGVVLLFVLAVNRGWIGPVERVAFGALVSAAAVGAGFLVRSRYGQYHAALAAVGAGIAGGYATLLAAVVLYELVPQPAALGIAAGIAAVGVVISLLWNAQLVAALGLVGATLAPGAVALDSGISAPGTGFAAFVFAGTAVVALLRDWRPLLVVGVLASLPQAAALAASDPAAAAGALGVTLGFAALYLAAGIALQLRAERPGLERPAAGLVLVSATLSFASAAALLEGTPQSAALLAIAGVYGVLTAGLFARDRDLAAVLAVAALTLGAIALATVLDGPALVAVWSAEAAGLAWLAGRVRDLRYGAGALAYLALAAVHALALDAPPDQLYVEVANPAEGVASLVAFVLAGALVAAAARTWREDMAGGLGARSLERVAAARGPLSAGLLWGAGAVAAYAGALGILELVGPFGWGHVGVAGLWAVAGAALLVAGAALGRFPVVVGAAAWLAVVTVHVLWFDLAMLEQAERGWAALALAVPALAGGYVAELVKPGALVSLPFVLLGAAFGGVTIVQLAAPGDPTGYSLLGAAAAFTALAAPVFPRPALRQLATTLWTVALSFALAASAVLLEGTALVGAWTGAAVLLAALAALTREGRLQLPAAAFAALAAGYGLATVAAPAGLFSPTPDPGSGVPAAFLAALAASAVAVLARPGRFVQRDALDRELGAAQGRVRSWAAWPAGVLALYGLSLAVLAVVAWAGSADLDTEFQRGHTAVSAVWGTVGLVLLYLGLRRGWRALLGAGFGLFGISLAKIFLFDLSQLSSVARAASFLAVGAILLTAGFFYQRLSRA